MVNISSNINTQKERLNSDGRQFYQCQQNKRKLKQIWSTFTQISTKQRYLNSDGRQFKHNQQNKRKFKSWWSTILTTSKNKRKFKQWWSIIPTLSIKWTITSHLKSLNIKKTMTYDVRNPGSGLGQAQKCGRVKLVNTIQ